MMQLSPIGKPPPPPQAVSEMLTWISEATTHVYPWLETATMSPQTLAALDAIKRVDVQKGDEVAGEKRKEEKGYAPIYNVRALLLFVPFRPRWIGICPCLRHGA
jgi:hypothetical protein